MSMPAVTPFREIGVATIAALIGALGFKQIHAGEWPEGARIVVERDDQLYLIEISLWKEDS